MKLMPVDLTHKTFTKKMMGVDGAEVEDFLREIADQMEAMIKERNQLREALREKEMFLLEYKEKDRVLRETISAASTMVDRMRADADREAKLIIQDALHKADQITGDARNSMRRIYEEVGELKRARLQFEANLKALAQAHLTLLEQGEKFMPPMQLPQVGMTEVGSGETIPEISPLASR